MSASRVVFALSNEDVISRHTPSWPSASGVLSPAYLFDMVAPWSRSTSLHLSPTPFPRSRRHRHARRRLELFVRTDLFHTGLARTTTPSSISSSSSATLLGTPHLNFLTPRTTHSASHSPARRHRPHRSSSSRPLVQAALQATERFGVSLHAGPAAGRFRVIHSSFGRV